MTFWKEDVQTCSDPLEQHELSRLLRMIASTAAGQLNSAPVPSSNGKSGKVWHSWKCVLR